MLELFSLVQGWPHAVDRTLKIQFLTNFSPPPPPICLYHMSFQRYLQLKKSLPSDPVADPSDSDSDCPVRFKDEPNEDRSMQQMEQSAPPDSDKVSLTKEDSGNLTITADSTSNLCKSVTEKLQVKKTNVVIHVIY